MVRAVEAVNQSFPEATSERWEACERVMPNEMVCVGWIDQGPMIREAAVRLLHEMGYYLVERGCFGRGEVFYQRALAISQKLWPQGDYRIVALLNSLGYLRIKQGK